jgi:NADH-quinone oxidoreductase subunit H
MSAIAVTLFLGGPAGPSLGFLDANSTINVWVMPVFWFMIKVLALLFGTVWLRATMPRLRYDQLMRLGWKYMIEIAFLWIMVSAVIVIGREEDWNLFIVVPAAVVGALLIYGVLWLSMPKRGELLKEDIK